ncbi:MAG: hypothetical protein ABI995_09350 [Acidobacteriota bacterium]
MKRTLMGSAVITLFCLFVSLAETAEAQITESVSITCSSSGQLCDPPYTSSITVAVRGVVTAEFTASPGHCSTMKAHIGIDGVEKAVSAILGPGESTDAVELGTVSAGNHSVFVKAEGQVTGCNVGRISSWGGTLRITLPVAPGIRGSLAHFTSQDGWQEDIVVLNTGSNTTSSTLKFLAENGSTMPVSLTDSRAGTTAVLSTQEADLVSRSILPLTSRGSPTLPLLVGSTLLYGSQALDGFGIFRFKPTNQEAVVPLETRDATSYILAFDNTNNVSTGVAISNVTAVAASVEVIIRNDQGIQIGTAPIQLAGNGHTSFVLADQLPLTRNLRGTLEIVTPDRGRLSAVGIRFTPPGTLTTIPILVNAANPSGSIAHFAAGGGWRSILVLVNAGTSSAQAHLRFYDDAGNPATLPLTRPQTPGPATPASAVDQTLAAKQVFVLESNGAPGAGDPLRTGSVQFTSDGSIHGFVVFRYEPNGQEAAVAMESRSTATSYTIAFDNTDGVVTGIAVNNASATGASVPVIIRDENAAQIFSGSLLLPGNGHTSFLLASQYVVTANKRGTIEFLRPDPSKIGVVGIRSQPALTFTSLPAIAR